MCRCICKCCGTLVVLLVSLAGLFSIPAISKAYWEALHLHLPPNEVPRERALPVPYLLLVMLGQLPNVARDGIAFLEGFMNEPDIAFAVNAFEGPGLHYTIGQANSWALVRVGHQANKEMYYDPTTDRRKDLMIGVNLTESANYFAKGVQPTLLSVGTSDPHWWKTRDLWTATIPALARHASSPDLVFPKWDGMTEGAFCKSLDGFDPLWSGLLRYGDPSVLAPKELGYFVSYNFNKQLFGVELTKEWADTILELFGHIVVLLGNAATGTAPPESMSKRGIEIQEAYRDFVLKHDFGKKFVAEAKKRGLDGPGSLASMLYSFIVAGQATPGTTFYAMWVIERLNSDRKTMIPLYEKDPEAFNLEVVRLKGAGGANSNFHAKKTTEWKLPSGKIVKENAGTLTATNLKMASYDPAIWGGPSKTEEYARKFTPGRENREQVIVWMSELRDIRKCPNMTGCAAAPRFCPGAELTQRLTRQVVDFYVKTCIQSTKTAKDEM